MYRNVLIAHDGSEGSAAALQRAVTVAAEYHAALAMVWVRGRMPHHASSIGEVDEEREAAEEYFGKLKAQAESAAAARGLTIQCVCLAGSPAREIVAYAERNGYDLIVIGQVGHSGFLGRVLGPTADRISETAHCDVLIVRRPQAGGTGA